MKTFDIIFKLVILLILGALLYLQYQNTGTQRYSFVFPLQLHHPIVFDSKTGDIHDDYEVYLDKIYGDLSGSLATPNNALQQLLSEPKPPPPDFRKGAP